MKNRAVKMIISVSTNVIFGTIALVIIVLLGSRAYTFGNRIFNERAISDSVSSAKTVEIVIEDDVKAKDLAFLLYANGLVEDENITYFQIILSDYKDKFIGGTYELSTHMTPTEIMKVLSGKAKGEK